MRIRVDCYVGENPKIDISFLERRKFWLPYTGIYLEFLLKGEYCKQVDFQIVSPSENITVVRHAWNRFFVNVHSSETVHFKVNIDGEEMVSQLYTFNVVEIDVPLLFSVLNLFQYPVTDVRFFANRLSENLVNGTRIQYFTPTCLEKLSRSDFDIGDSYWKFFELLFSILTERGITVYVSPFGQRVPYPLDFIPKLKPILWELMEIGKKFHIIWDFSEGLRKKELGSLVDASVNRFSHDVPMVTQKDMVQKLGGEGFSHQFVINSKIKDLVEPNERGVKILRLRENVSDFYKLRKYVTKAVSKGYGFEYVYFPKAKKLHDMHYSMSRALYMGYADAKGVE